MVVTCEQVWREISAYLDDAVSPDLRAAMDEHFPGCQKCSAVLEGTRNVIGLYGEERMFEPPLGFSQRLHRRLEENMPRQRGTIFGWLVAVAATVLVVGSFEIARSSSFVPSLRSKLAEPASGVPADLMVVVAEDGKTFHVAGCTFIHEKAKLRTITASEAIREGYAPCVRCMRKYLSVNVDPDDDDEGQVANAAGDSK